MVTKHKFNLIIICEYCKTHCTSENDMKDHMKIHKLEQNKLQNCQENQIKSNEELMAAFEEEKQEDIQSHKDIEQLQKECEEDMRAMTLRMRIFIVRAKAKTNLTGNICCCVSSPPLHWMGSRTSLSVYTLINK